MSSKAQFGGIHSEETGTAPPLIKKRSDIKLLQTYVDISSAFELHKQVYMFNGSRAQLKGTKPEETETSSPFAKKCEISSQFRHILTFPAHLNVISKSVSRQQWLLPLLAPRRVAQCTVPGHTFMSEIGSKSHKQKQFTLTVPSGQLSDQTHAPLECLFTYNRRNAGTITRCKDTEHWRRSMWCTGHSARGSSHC